MNLFSRFSGPSFPSRVRQAAERLAQTVEIAHGSGEQRQSLREATDELRKSVEEIDLAMRGRGYQNGHHS